MSEKSNEKSDEKTTERCAVCGWPLAESREKGCMRGDCSMRPPPKQFYDPERAARENPAYEPALAAMEPEQLKVYVASSWRNDYQPHVVAALREDGHDVYDFKDAEGFHWSEVDPQWADWPRDLAKYLDGLEHPAAVRGFNRDMSALRRCDVCVYVMPCGVSASLEAGWAVGAGIPTIVYVPGLREPDLMVKMAAGVTMDLGTVRAFVRAQRRRTPAAPQPSRDEDEAFAELTEKAFEWLTEKVYEGNGALMFSTTENGNIGLFIGGDETATALACGDEVLDTLIDAYERSQKVEAQP